MKNSKLRNFLEYGSIGIAVVGGIACAYAVKDGLSPMGLSSGLNVATTSGTALVSSCLIQMGVHRIAKKIADYHLKNEKKEFVKSALEEARKKPNQYKIIEFDKDKIYDMSKSFPFNDKSMEVDIYGKQGQCFHAWSSSCQVVDDSEKNKLHLIVAVDNLTNVTLSFPDEERGLYGLEERPAMRIRMDTMHNKEIFMNKMDILAKGFHKGEFPADKSIPTFNFPEISQDKAQDKLNERESFTLAKTETKSLIPKINKSADKTKVIDSFEK